MFAQRFLNVALIALFAGSVCAAPDPRVVLFDFERGVGEWKGNPWGAGKARAEPAAGARFGKGGLRVIFEDTTKGASVIAPYFPEDAPWHGRAWGGLSLWMRGVDDAPHTFSVNIETRQPGGGFAATFTIQGKEWRRYEVTTSTVWNREGVKIDWGAMKRLYFISYGTLTFEVDQIVLEPVSRLVPFDTDPVALCPRVNEPPKLDGVLDDPCWEKAGRIGGFVENQNGAPAHDATEVRLCCDAEHLYIGARLSLADASKIRATMTRRDAPVFEEDCLELFFGPKGDGDFYQLDLNAIGTLMDLSGRKQLSYNADWQAKTRRDEHGWTAEVAISFSSFAVLAGSSPHSPGDVWDFNVGREVPATSEITCWSCTRGMFSNRERWGHLLFTGSSVPASPGPQPTLLEYEYGAYGVRWAAPEGMPRVSLAVGIEGRGANAAWSVGQSVGLSPATEGEPLLQLSHASPNPALARWHFTATDAEGNIVAYCAGRFQIYPPPKERPKPSLALLPQPKEMRPGKGHFSLPAWTTISTIGLPEEDIDRVAGLLTAEVKTNYGLEWTIGKSATVSLICTDQPESLRPLFPVDRVAGFTSLPDEGYLFEVTPQRVAIAAKTAHGVYCGVQTFLQAVGLSTEIGAKPICPSLSIRDFPDLPVRAVTMSLPNDRWGYPNDAPFTPKEFEDYLYRTLIRHKINTLVLIVGQAIKLDTHPELAGPAAWTKDQVREVLKFARDHYLEIVPLQTILGHAQWFTLNYPALQEEGDNNIACVSNPETHKILTDVITEIADLFQPKRFHLGMDEAWWKTLDVPEEKRCKLCAGKPKSDLFASQAIRYHDLLKARGIETMIWADMLLPEHNGGAPYDTSKALDRLPRDILLCNWSTSLAPLSSKRFHDAGFRVIQSNSNSVNRQQAAWLIGNMMGCWSKSPWIVDSIAQGIQWYSYLTVLQCAERSWNPDVNVERETWNLERDFVEQDAAGALMLLARPSTGHAAMPSRPLPLDAFANLSTVGSKPTEPQHWFSQDPSESLDDLRDGSIKVGALPFTPIGSGLPVTRLNAVAFDPKGATVPVKSKAGALAFLYGCHLPENQREAFLNRFKLTEAIRGVLIGTVRVHYTDGASENFELRYGLNVLPWKMRENLLPYCYGAAGALLTSTSGMRQRDPRGRDASLFAAVWANPHPEKAIVSVELIASGAEATPFVMAITAWPAR